MSNGLGFLYGKVSMPNGDLDRWLAVSEFKSKVLEMVQNGATIDDVSILLLCEGILNENLNSDMIDGVSRQKLSDVTASLRTYIEDFKFKPNWLREQFPSVWRDIKNRVSNENLVLIPTQIGRYIQVLKYVSNLASTGGAEVYIGGIDPFYVGHVTVSLQRLSIEGLRDTSELFGRLRFCDSIDIEVVEGKAEIALTVGHIMMKESEFHARVKQKKAWVLQWNKDFKSNLN